MASKNGYILALIAGIIGIISLIAPIAFHTTSFVDSYVWMWGLYTWKIGSGDTDYNFIDDSDLLTWVIVATLLLLVATILLLSSGAKAHKRNSSYGFVWIFSGLLMIAAPIVYYIGLMEEIPTWLSDVYWDYYDFHFAFFGPFIAGVFAIIAGVIK